MSKILLLPLFSLGRGRQCHSTLQSPSSCSLALSQFNPLTRIVHVFLPPSFQLVPSLWRSRSSLLSFFSSQFTFVLPPASQRGARERTHERGNASFRPPSLPSLISTSTFSLCFSLPRPCRKVLWQPRSARTDGRTDGAGTESERERDCERERGGESGDCERFSSFPNTSQPSGSGDLWTPLFIP